MLAFASSGEGSAMKVAKTAPSAKIVENNANYGVSIGTVDAQLYSESGLRLDYFGDDQYIAKTSDGTYMGFALNSFVDEDGNVSEAESVSLVSIQSSEECVTIPDKIKVGDTIYSVTGILSYSNLRYGFNSGIKILTVPATIDNIYSSYRFDSYLDAIYMLGAAPNVSDYYFQVPNIYVCNKKDISGYFNNKYYSNSNILPYGWNYEWITVNVEKKGEFAETYLTQNDYDWGAAQYVKVIGNINDIDLSAIKNLTTLMKLDLSETSITELPESFMYNRTSLVEVKLPSSLAKIGNAAFYGCTSLESFDLNGIKEIGYSVFSGCSSLLYINLKGVQSIGDAAFYRCNKLNNIDLSTVITIGRESFENCTSLESVDLTSVIRLDSESFNNCSSLRDVVLGTSLQKMNYRTFSNTAIESISIPESLTSIEEEVFENCPNLKSVEIPASVTYIGSEAFRACTNLSNVSLPTGLVSIHNSAFYGCTSLEEVTIPATIKNIGSDAFSNTGIKTFKCYAVVPPYVTSSFIGHNMDMSRTYLYVPPFSKDFYRNTEYWSDFYLMRSIEDPVDYIFVDRPLTINLEEEDNAVVANNPEMVLTSGSIYSNYYYDEVKTIGQLTAIGEGTLSAGKLTIDAILARRTRNSYQSCPTLINYADKMRADNVTINMSFYNYNSSGEWHFISLPYDVKVSDIIPGNDVYWVIRRYDSVARAAGETSSTWVDLTNDDTLEAGKGYIISAVGGEYYWDEYGYQYQYYPNLYFSSGNSITKNNIFRSSDVSVPLTEYSAEFAHNRSWNLIGNPYPCYFDMHFLNEDFTSPITVWNGSSYVAYSPVDDDLVLSPYEAFFVQCPLDANEMSFKEGGRLHSDDGKKLYKLPAVNDSFISAEDRNVFNFVLSGENFEDRARIVFNADAKSEYEIGRDASKFFAGSDDNAQIYVNSDIAYSISERPVSDGMATLGIRSSKENVYTLAINGKFSNEWSVMLTDNETGITVDLTKESYEFISSSTENSSRFSVKFTLDANGQSGIDSVVADYGKDAMVSVADINGVVVYNGRLTDINVPTSGIYLISNGKETRKAILK